MNCKQLNGVPSELTEPDLSNVEALYEHEADALLLFYLPAGFILIAN